MAMSKFSDFVKSPHILLALATGISIVALAYVSKRILDEPMRSLEFAVAPFVQMIYEYLLHKHKNSKYLKPLYWVIAIFSITIIIILSHLI